MKDLDIRIDDKYRVVRKIGEGGFGIVYIGADLETGEEVAMKLERHGPNMPRLRYEAETYKSLSGGVGIPNVRWYGEECEYYVLIQDLLGPSLEDLFNFCDRRFSLKTVLLLADQLISRIEYVHTKSYVHRDIKPENFLMGTGKLGNVVYIIDFDAAETYRDEETLIHKKYYDKCSFGGTSLFASINNHMGIMQSRRDDLECLGYVMIYFACGSLPWQGYKAATNDERNRLIKELKMTTPIEDLCYYVPPEFVIYFKYVRNLAYDEEPDYSHLRKIFRDLFVENGFEYDDVYDWTVRKFFMMHEDLDPLDTGIESSEMEIDTAELSFSASNNAVAIGDK